MPQNEVVMPPDWMSVSRPGETPLTLVRALAP
jgi:hypothetical protein